LIEIAEITKKMTRTSRITDFFINIVGSFYLSLFFFFFLFFFLNLYDKSMLA
jgi:fluoride ion exporter CrcB/FEX